MNLDDQPEWIHARQAERRAAFERQQYEARRAVVAEARIPRRNRIKPLPSIEDDEERIAQLARMREMRSAPVVSTAAELVWRLITGAGDAPGLDILATSLSEVDKISHFESLRATDMDAALRFANAVGITFVKTIIMPDATTKDMSKSAPVTDAILADLRLVETGQLTLDYAAYLVSSSGFGSGRVLIRTERYNYSGSHYLQVRVDVDELGQVSAERIENVYRVGDY